LIGGNPPRRGKNASKSNGAGKAGGGNAPPSAAPSTKSGAEAARVVEGNDAWAERSARQGAHKERVTVDAEKRLTKMEPGQRIGGPGRVIFLFDWRSKKGSSVMAHHQSCGSTDDAHPQ
jgi:hypothetical protein